MSIHPHEQLLRAARAQARPAPRNSSRTTQPDRAWSGSSPGSPPNAGAASHCATSTSSRITPDCATGPPRSTCAHLVNAGLTRRDGPGPWPDRPGPQRLLIRTRAMPRLVLAGRTTTLSTNQV
jgi:hypothetical protein